MELRIGPLPSRGPDVTRWCEVYAAGRAADSGHVENVAELVVRIGASPDDPDVARFAAWRGERLVGVAEVLRDRKSEAFTRVYVDPAHRRAGVGHALAATVIAWASARGCRPLRATLVPADGGRFAESLGARVAVRLVVVVGDLRVPPPVVAVPAGVRLRRWRNRTPDELLDAYAALRRAVGDAPDARIQIDVEARSPQWIREWERARTGTGNDLWVSAALDAVSGTPVAFTEVEVPAVGGSGAGVADQHDTAVLPGWRGRGLARWLKADMVEWLRAERPNVDRLTSTINEQNRPMLRVCEALGFQQTWQRHLVVRDE
jgi:GNAT superfamily N-acetyltransferase